MFLQYHKNIHGLRKSLSFEHYQPSKLGLVIWNFKASMLFDAYWVPDTEKSICTALPTLAVATYCTVFVKYLIMSCGLIMCVWSNVEGWERVTKECCVLKQMSWVVIDCTVVVSPLSKLSDFATQGGNRQLCSADICFCNLLFPRENPFRDLSKTQDSNPRPKNTSVERVSFRLLMSPPYKNIFYSIQRQNEARVVCRHVCCSWLIDHPINTQKCACRLRTFRHTLLFSQYLGVFPIF